MRLILLSARKDLRRIRRDPIGLATWIGIPLLVGIILVALFGRGEPPKPRGLVLIADQDNSLISSFLANAYTQGKLGEMLTVQRVPLEEGRRRIGTGDASALLVIPKGFGQAVLRNQPAQLQLVTNPAQYILPGIVREVTSSLLEGAWYLQQLIGDELNQFAGRDTAPPDALVASFSVKVSRLASGLRRYVDPPLINVATQVVEPNPGRRFSMSAAMFPSIMYMAVLFLAFGFGGDIWKEKLGGTLRRLAVTPGSVTGFLGGKVLALGVVYAFLGVAAVLAGAFLVGTDVRNPAVAVLWIAASGTGFYLLSVVLSTLATGPRAANMLGNLVLMLLGMLGGCFFPFEIMPEFLARIGRLTPNGWALLRFREILSGEASAGGLVLAFGCLAVGAAVLFSLAAWRLRRRFVV